VGGSTQVLGQFVLVAGRYAEPLVCRDEVRSRVFRGVVIELARIW
jgi:hypothetical protein